MQVEPGAALRAFYAKMLSQLGPQDWWPARSRLEIIVGAILVQNTAWQNATLALKRLRVSGLLSLARLQKASPAEIETCVRPAGFFRQKARTIRNFLDWLERDCQGSLVNLFALQPKEARGRLLGIKGLGPETVDAILLYAGGHAIFVADSYTRRVLARHRMVHPEADYDDVQSFMHRHLPSKPDLFNEYHALLVSVGKQYCRRPAPQCTDCPLEGFLGPNQPVQLSSLPRAGNDHVDSKPAE
jgi:endonuclease III related protein